MLPTALYLSYICVTFIRYDFICKVFLQVLHDTKTDVYIIKQHPSVLSLSQCFVSTAHLQLTHDGNLTACFFQQKLTVLQKAVPQYENIVQYNVMQMVDNFPKKCTKYLVLNIRKLLHYSWHKLQMSMLQSIKKQ